MPDQTTITITLGSTQLTLKVCPICSGLIAKSDFWDAHADWHLKMGQVNA